LSLSYLHYNHCVSDILVTAAKRIALRAWRRAQSLIEADEGAASGEDSDGIVATGISVGTSTDIPITGVSVQAKMGVPVEETTGASVETGAFVGSFTGVSVEKPTGDVVGGSKGAASGEDSDGIVATGISVGTSTDIPITGVSVEAKIGVPVEDTTGASVETGVFVGSLTGVSVEKPTGDVVGGSEGAVLSVGATTGVSVGAAGSLFLSLIHISEPTRPY